MNWYDLFQSNMINRKVLVHGSIILLVAALSLYLLCPQVGYASPPSNPILRVGTYENPPKVFINSSGDTAGIFPDVLEVISIQEGWQLEYVHGTWAQCLKRLEEGKIDIMVDIAFSVERAERFLFSDENVFLNWGTVYTKNNFLAESFFDLKGRSVAVVGEDIHTIGDNGIMQLAEKFELGLSYLVVDSYQKVLEMVNAGKVDAGVVNRLYGAVSEKKYKIATSPIVFNPVQLKFAFHKNSRNRIIAEKIDYHLKELKSTPDSVFHQIVNSYLSGVEYDLASYREIRPFQLSEKERAWLRNHQVIRIGVDHAYPPYSFRDKSGAYQGIAIDVVNLIATHLGLKIEIAKGLSWQEILEGAKDKTLDVVLTAVETPERKDYLRFTGIYLPTPLVITTREDDDWIEGPEDLGGREIALVKGYSSAERVVREHQDISPFMVETPLDGLAAVSAGEVDCYIGVLGVNDYLTRENGISNLKVAGRYDMLLFGQRIGVRKDWPELAIILDKALNAISGKKKAELFKAWISSKASLESTAALQENNALSLEETVWVREHQNIFLGVDPEFAPFEYFDKNGSYQGIASEYIRILNMRLGLNMQVVPDLTWKEAVESVKNGKLDALPCVDKTYERQHFLKFTKPYLNYHRVIITRTNLPFITSIEDIRGQRVSVQQDTSHEGYLAENTDIQATKYPTLLAAIKAVADGKADAFIGNLASSIYWIRKENITNLKVAGPVAYASEHLHFAVRKDWPQLVRILEKGLNSISPLKEKRIRERWIKIEFEPGIKLKEVLGYLLQITVAIIVIIVAILAWNHKLKKEIVKREAAEKALQAHHDELESLIGQRTADLKEANAKLLQEAVDRKKSEEEKIKLQKQLFHSQKLEAIGTLAGGIAHDFNNILSGMIGYTELALTDVKDMPSTEKMLDQVLKAGGRATDLVKQILSFSRSQKSELKPIAPLSITKEVLKLIRASLPANIEITQFQNSESHVFANATHIHQILMNLCTNAAHAMRTTGGVLTVSLQDVTLGKHDLIHREGVIPGDFLKISVEDTGIGMSKDVQAKAFDPFFTTKELGEGTGMGLSTVHGIIAEYGGFVSLYSQPGQGTAIHVFIPAISGSDDIGIKKSAESMTGGTERILFVDDEQILIELAEEALSQFGYQVATFSDSTIALVHFQKNPDAFDLVITDMTMPKMTGDILTQKIHSLRSDVPVILCTGFSEIIDARKAKALDIDAFLYKPVVIAKLLETIRKVLNHSA